MGNNLRIAKDAAWRLLAQNRATDPVEELVRRASQSTDTMDDLIAAYRKDILPKLSRYTQNAYSGSLNLIGKSFGKTAIAAIDARAVARFLHPNTNGMWNQHLTVFRELMKLAVSRGLRSDNPLRDLERKPTNKVRGRLSLDQFEAIRSSSPDWFARAMDLALDSGQRRGDVTMLCNRHWDGTYLSLRQEKTKTLVQIGAGPKLRAAVEACVTDMSEAERNNPDTHLIRRNGKPVTRECLTETFQEIRDGLPCFAHMPKPERPTWHELRSLGAHLQSTSTDIAETAALLGHVDKRGTFAQTKHYLRGHEIVLTARSR